MFKSRERHQKNQSLAVSRRPDQVPAINDSGSARVAQVDGTRRMQVGFNLGKGVEGMPGDTLQVQLTAKEINPRENADHGEVRWDCRVTNQDEEVVAQYDVLTMVAKNWP